MMKERRRWLVLVLFAFRVAKNDHLVKVSCILYTSEEHRSDEGILPRKDTEVEGVIARTSSLQFYLLDVKNNADLNIQCLLHLPPSA